MMQNKVRHIHLIGIGGVGMSGIAEVLINLGYEVSGSDEVAGYNIDNLIRQGIKIFIGHLGSNIDGADVVVVSSAINQNNPEVVRAREENIPVVPRAKMLAELMRFKFGIAISGTHGKTTTTSMMAEVFRSCGLDPTFVIGGKLTTTGSNAKLGAGDFMIVEADESDASFLYLKPMLAVVTNIDLDHMATYNHDENQLKKTFSEFLNNLPFYGLAVVCGEDPRVNEIVGTLTSRVIRYGLNSSCDIYATNLIAANGKMTYTLNIAKTGLSYDIYLNAAGEHNVLNSLAVIACSLDCGCSLDKIAKALASFQGVGRRLQEYPKINYAEVKALLFDDYAHHPTEIKATLNAVRGAYPNHRLVVIFQPHRYTRTKDLFNDFIKVLNLADYLIITQVYSAGEPVINGFDGLSLTKAIKKNGFQKVKFAAELSDAKQQLLAIIKENDLVLTMGAGSISKLANLILEN